MVKKRMDRDVFLSDMRQRWHGASVSFEHKGYDYSVRRLRYEAKPTKEEIAHSEKPRIVVGTIVFNDKDGWCHLVEDDGYQWEIDEDMLAAQERSFPITHLDVEKRR